MGPELGCGTSYGPQNMYQDAEYVNLKSPEVIAQTNKKLYPKTNERGHFSSIFPGWNKVTTYLINYKK